MNVKESHEPKVGDIYLCLDTSWDDIYYEVVGLKTADMTTGETIIQFRGILRDAKVQWWPLLFLDQKFVKVNETTVRILFGNKGEKNGTTSNDHEKG